MGKKVYFRDHGSLGTYRATVLKMQDLRRSADTKMVYKITGPGRGGRRGGRGAFRIIAIEPNLYMDMLIGRVPCPPGLTGSRSRHARTG